LRLLIVDRKFGISKLRWNSFKNREQRKHVNGEFKSRDIQKKTSTCTCTWVSSSPSRSKYHTFHQQHEPTSPIPSRYCHRRTNDTISDRSLIDDLPCDMLTRRSGHYRWSIHLTIYASTVFLHTPVSCVDGSSCFDSRCRSAS
jgi:hypothetical protein